MKVAAPAPSAAPFDRLLLVANNVMEAGVLRDAAAPGVAAVLYDYYLWTPEELLAAAKEAVGPGGRVASIGLVAAGQPGLVRVLRSADMQLDHADHLTLDIQALVQGGGRLFPSSSLSFSHNTQLQSRLMLSVPSIGGASACDFAVGGVLPIDIAPLRPRRARVPHQRKGRTREDRSDQL